MRHLQKLFGINLSRIFWNFWNFRSTFLETIFNGNSIFQLSYFRSCRYDDGVDDDYFNNDEVDDNDDWSAAPMVVAIKPAACERDNPPIVLPMVEITREIHTLYLSSFLGLLNMKGGGGQRLWNPHWSCFTFVWTIEDVLPKEHTLRWNLGSVLAKFCSHFLAGEICLENSKTG